MSNGSTQLDGQAIGEFIKFERSAIPMLVHIVFWGGLFWVGRTSYYMIKNRYGADEQIFYAIIYFIVMAAAIRVFCEIAILLTSGHRSASVVASPTTPQAAVGTFQINQPAATPIVNAPPAAATSTTPAAATMKICASCGTPDEAGKKFCTNCGAELPVAL